jgi:hypothetical protein
MLPFGVPKEEITERLKLYQRCRHERASKIQHFTRLAGRDAADIATSGEKLNSKYIQWLSSTKHMLMRLVSSDGISIL